MADYWKSQDRKYCDFCKCWIADNKPSRDFHENGKRHKENVKKRLKSISKDSAKSFKESQKVDATIKAMEAAGLEAYRKDVEHNAASDLTSIAINKKLEDDNLAIASGNNKKVWHEAVTTDGKSYYWNTFTNETTWTPPSEGYLSLMDQKTQKNKETLTQLKVVQKYERREALLRSQEQKQEEDEARARIAREKLKDRRVKEESPPPVYGPIIDSGKNDPYGKWQTVQTTTKPVVDLQLPKQEYYDCPVVAEPEPVVKEFKEKTFDSLEGNGPSEQSSFKKRKIPSGSKRNSRQRLDVD